MQLKWDWEKSKERQEQIPNDIQHQRKTTRIVRRDIDNKHIHQKSDEREENIEALDQGKDGRKASERWQEIVESNAKIYKPWRKTERIGKEN